MERNIEDLLSSKSIALLETYDAKVPFLKHPIWTSMEKVYVSKEGVLSARGLGAKMYFDRILRRWIMV